LLPQLPTPSLSASPPPQRQRQAPPKLSARLPQLGSSEGTPSEHSSVYDAGSFATSFHASQPATDSDQDETLTSEGGAPDYVSPHLRQHALGTKLSTITEQKSVQTLKMANSSDWNLPRHLGKLRAPTARDMARLRHLKRGRRRCVSFDQVIPPHRGLRSDTSQSSTSSLPENPPHVRPAKPLHPPPVRCRTPTGLPRWPGKTEERLTGWQAVAGSRPTLVEHLRHRLGIRPDASQGCGIVDAFRPPRRLWARGLLRVPVPRRGLSPGVAASLPPFNTSERLRAGR
jgi:hypothetical protein